MKESTKKSWIVVGVIIILLVLLIGGANWTDRNYKPGSKWPVIWGAAAVGAAISLVGGSLYLWFRKK